MNVKNWSDEKKFWIWFAIFMLSMLILFNNGAY